MYKVNKYRDLTLVELNNDEILVIACDSSGAIGAKKNDVLKVKSEVVGYYTAQVALMEVLAIGATPVTLINNLSVEMCPTGEEIIKGINKALIPLSSEYDIMITGSTEENFPVSQTSMGITVIGLLSKEKWQLPKASKGNLAVVLGIPKVGEEVILDFEHEIMTLSCLLQVLRNNKIKDILPVGSRGILKELEVMAESNNLSYHLKENITLNLTKSAGPSTCAIISIGEEGLYQLQQELSIPINVIAEFV